MTNEEKAREIAGLCETCLGDGINLCCDCEKRGEYFGALEMAEWKDQQFKEYLEKKRLEYAHKREAHKFNACNEIINELFKDRLCRKENRL